MISLLMSLSLALSSAADCSGADCPTVTVTPLAASHHGSFDGRELTWQTVVVAQDGELLTPSTYRVSFAVPLSAASEITGDGPVEVRPVRDARGRLIAVDAPRAAWSESQHRRHDAWTRELHLTIHVPAVGEGRVPVAVPLLAGQAVQKAVVSDSEGLNFEPDLALGIEQHLRYYVLSGIAADDRRRCDELVGERELLPRQLGVYLRADARLHDAGMLVGRLEPVGPHRRQVALVAVGGTAALLGLMALAYRLLARSARLERLLALVEADRDPLDPR